MLQNSEEHEIDATRNREKRAARWSEYFRGLVREWQYADITSGRALLSKSDIARLVKVADVTIGQWWDGRAFPSRANALYVAAAFDKSQNQVLEAAGYVPHLDVTYQAINEIMQAVREDQYISDKEKIRLDAALIVLVTSDWMDSNPDWSELVKVVLKQKLTLQEKAGRIANFVELSRQG